jgi:hemin uptake protein HemP
VDVAMREFNVKAQPCDSELETVSSLESGQTPVYVSQRLFRSGNEIRIDHNGAVYTLRITRSGGLILNK